MNSYAARKYGLKAGDLVEIETDRGRKATGRVQIRESIHPACIGIMGVSGHWAKGMPVARNKGTNFNSLIEFEIKTMDPLTATVDVCVSCKVKKL